MIAFRVENVREFFSMLLTGEVFDDYHVGNCEITTFVNFFTDGRRCERARMNGGEEDLESENGAFSEYERTSSGTQVRWSELKPVVMEMIRESKTPGRLSIDLYKYFGSRDMGSLMVRFSGGELTVTTGYMQKEFTLDRRGSEDWDDSCQRFLMNNGVSLAVL